MAGNFLDAIVLSADVDERVCALALLIEVKRKPWWRDVKVVFADNGFAGAGFERQVQNQCGVKLHIVRRNPEALAGFHVLPKRWLIEQVFGCWGRNRRLSRDYEQNTKLSRAMLQAASIHRFLNRIKPKLALEPYFRYRHK
jgi:putative transposase